MKVNVCIIRYSSQVHRVCLSDEFHVPLVYCAHSTNNDGYNFYNVISVVYRKQCSLSLFKCIFKHHLTESWQAQYFDVTLYLMSQEDLDAFLNAAKTKIYADTNFSVSNIFPSYAFYWVLFLFVSSLFDTTFTFIPPV